MNNFTPREAATDIFTQIFAPYDVFVHTGGSIKTFAMNNINKKNSALLAYTGFYNEEYDDNTGDYIHTFVVFLTDNDDMSGAIQTLIDKIEKKDYTCKLNGANVFMRILPAGFTEELGDVLLTMPMELYHG